MQTQENTGTSGDEAQEAAGEKPIEGAAAEPTEIVSDIKGAFIEVSADDDGLWHWAIWAGNGRIVARSGQTHAGFKACVQSLRSVRELWVKNLPIVRAHRPN